MLRLILNANLCIYIISKQISSSFYLLLLILLMLEFKFCKPIFQMILWFSMFNIMRSFSSLQRWNYERNNFVQTRYSYLLLLFLLSFISYFRIFLSPFVDNIHIEEQNNNSQNYNWSKERSNKITFKFSEYTRQMKFVLA